MRRLTSIPSAGCHAPDPIRASSRRLLPASHEPFPLFLVVAHRPARDRGDARGRHRLVGGAMAPVAADSTGRLASGVARHRIAVGGRTGGRTRPTGEMAAGRTSAEDALGPRAGCAAHRTRHRAVPLRADGGSAPYRHTTAVRVVAGMVVADRTHAAHRPIGTEPRLADGVRVAAARSRPECATARQRLGVRAACRRFRPPDLRPDLHVSRPLSESGVAATLCHRAPRRGRGLLRPR